MQLLGNSRLLMCNLKKPNWTYKSLNKNFQTRHFLARLLAFLGKLQSFKAASLKQIMGLTIAISYSHWFLPCRTSWFLDNWTGLDSLVNYVEQKSASELSTEQLSVGITIMPGLLYFYPGVADLYKKKRVKAENAHSSLQVCSLYYKTVLWLNLILLYRNPKTVLTLLNKMQPVKRFQAAGS